MPYPHSRHQILELVKTRKVARENTQLELEKQGEHGARFGVNLDMVVGSFVDLRYLGKATALDQPPTYEAALILAGHRVRGAGHSYVGRNNLRAKQRIPAGWHQNKVDPILPTFHMDYNRHDPLPHFAPTDFGDFIGRCARLWTIDLKTPEVLL